MFSLYQKYWRTAFDIGVLIVTVWLVMWLFSFLYNLATPVFLSFVVFWIIEPLARRLNRWGIRKSIATGVSILLFVLVILGLFFGLGFIFTQQISQLAQNLPHYQVQLQEAIQELTTNMQGPIEALSPDIAAKLSDATGYITDQGAKIARSFLDWLVGAITSFSSFMVNFFIAIILAYFLSLEIETWKKLGRDRAPKTLKVALEFLRENVFRGIGAYLKAQSFLISITFVIIFISLLALDVNNAFSIALLAGIFDVLPLLGVSTLFIPWICYLFFTGDTILGVWLTVLLLVVTLARQFLEPRITGQTVGVSAFTMLAFMMVSLSLFGVIGLILAPILMILLKALYDQGYMHKWIRFPKDEFNVSPFAPPTEGPTDGAAR